MSRASDLADRLVGTADNVIVMEELGDDPESIEEFDGLAFLCDQCGWWCSTEELNNESSENLCDDCND